RPVVHPDRRLSGEHEPDVLDLARALSEARPDVLRPPPPRLVAGAAERHRPHAVEVEAALLEATRLDRLIEVDQLEVHGTRITVSLWRRPDATTPTFDDPRASTREESAFRRPLWTSSLDPNGPSRSPCSCRSRGTCNTFR